MSTHTKMTAVYQTKQIYELENLAYQRLNLQPIDLMEAAGKAAFEHLQAYWPEAKRITVYCGKGNNGGDGHVLARLAHYSGLEVCVYHFSPISVLGEPASTAAKASEAAGVSMEAFDLNQPIETDVIIDAMLGIGLSDAVQEPFASAITLMNASKIPILALDIPSGLDADTGAILGACIESTVTVTFIGLKRGLFTRKGPMVSGTLLLECLGISTSESDQINPSGQLLNWDQMTPMLPKRAADTSKGDYGHILVVGGDYGMGGAVRLAAEAAIRVGAGLVSVATRPEHVNAVSGARPEIMCHQIVSANDLKPLLERSTVIVLGPGLGKSDWAKSLFTTVLAAKQPKLLDADALNLLSEFPQIADDWILTPHPGEAARLLHENCQHLQNNRFKAVSNIQKRYGGVVVLKGLGTLIKGETEQISLCSAGNPGMASGGMGDVLSGVIGGLLAQKLSLLEAAQAGVFIHSQAADQAAIDEGERGLLAMDLIPYLRPMVNP